MWLLTEIECEDQKLNFSVLVSMERESINKKQTDDN